MQRRNFLKSTALASAAWLTPAFLRHRALLTNGFKGKKLVVIQLSGGNDSLNTMIPYRDDLYFKNRPSISLSTKDILKVTDNMGFHPALAALRTVYDKGNMAILNSVGYPNPNRSHFRSMDIWQTASASDQYLQTGWLGRYLDANNVDYTENYHALEIDGQLSLALKGQTQNGFAMTNPKQLNKTANVPFLKNVAAAYRHQVEHENVGYLYKTMIDTQESAHYLFEQSKVYTSKVEYPNTKFAKDLKLIAELITAETETQVYYVDLGGFDTHVRQLSTQAQLLEEYAEGVAAFIKDLERNRLFDDTLIMTFSEFGRRVQQNASGGTDHGTAGTTILMGGQLRNAGFLNDAPNLSKLTDGDLIYQIDFRQIYATILDNWLKADAGVILGGRFDKLGFL